MRRAKEFNGSCGFCTNSREMRVKKGEAEAQMPAPIEKWAKEAGEPWPPSGLHHYGFGSFWTWLQNGPHYSYTKFRAVPDARYVTEMWFDKITRQTWRN
ncbi:MULTISPECIES: hypothetical protein [unclassified Bradyrhizobium]|uniref:hypothetical protein n=1 Tax=unclassified Bradyrhizobium TaxID=2631580 RepID=UPI00230562E7|nr:MULTISPECIES: hypothetical protein [unclassified Bradyrhizobium]MDA9457670.1 hypothetical protein [Bradyrhizobium sp. CCBAU 21359]